jgi:hypothetical protein
MPIGTQLSNTSKSSLRLSQIVKGHVSDFVNKESQGFHENLFLNERLLLIVPMVTWVVRRDHLYDSQDTPQQHKLFP